MSKIIIELKEDILRIEINRPEKKNALNIAMYQEINEALSSSEEAKVILIQGHPEIFSSGNDLEDFIKMEVSQGSTPEVLKFLNILSTLSQPVVAAVNGPAIGIGTTLLLHCDFVYSAENAWFHLPFVNLGLCAEGGSSLLLPITIGYLRAAELLLLGEPFSAQKAYEYGIVTEIVSEHASLNVFETAWKTAKKLATRPAESLKITKNLMKKNLTELLHQRIHEEGQAFFKRLQDTDTQKILRGFLK